MSRITRAFLIVALLALLAAAALHVLVLAGVARLWPAMIHVSLFGWITGMILAVNYHMLPVFSGRDFPYQRLIAAHWGSFTAGIALATVGLVAGQRRIIIGGMALEAIAALIFAVVTITLFTRGAQIRTPPLPPVPDQQRVDRVGTQATKLAGVSLPLALGLIVAAYAGWLAPAWLLAAEHLATLGWLMLMVVGVAQHVLPRFSGISVRGVVWARAQLRIHVLALTLMVPALGLGWNRIFGAGALLMGVALLLFGWTIWPTLTVFRPRVTIRLRERTS